MAHPNGRCPAVARRLPDRLPGGCPAVARLVARWLPGWLPGGCCWGLCWVKEMHVFLCVPLPLGSVRTGAQLHFLRGTMVMHEEFIMVSESCDTSPLCPKCLGDARGDMAVQVSRAFNLARHSLWDQRPTFLVGSGIWSPTYM